jgi:hypothetical protein
VTPDGGAAYGGRVARRPWWIPRSPLTLARWAGELVRVAPGIVEAQLPGTGGIDARTRERVLLAVAAHRRDPVLGWVHRTWLEFLGPGSAPDPPGGRPDGPPPDPVLTYARSAVGADRPLDPTTLRVRYRPAVVRSLRASIARGEVQSGLGGLGWPTMAPELALAVVLRVAGAVAPPVPDPRVADTDEANMVVHLLAGSLPVLLGNTLLRAALLWNPLPLAVGVRPAADAESGGAAATIRIGRGRVEIVNGLRSDALVVIDGGLEALLRLATGAVVRQAAVRQAADPQG